jgi:hypothetical protein
LLQFLDASEEHMQEMTEDADVGMKKLHRSMFMKAWSRRAATRGGALRAPAAAAVTNPLASETSAAAHSEAQHAERAEQQAKQQEREFEDAQEIGEVDGAHQVWESMDAGRVEECLQAAMRAGGKALNTSRLNIVGEGRAGKTAWLRAVSNQAWKEVHMMM